MNDSEAKKEILYIAQEMLKGSIDLIIGCRLIKSLRHQTNISDNEIFVPFIGIDSQTDHYPLGKVRELCDPDYLARVDKEISDFLAFTSEYIRDACRDLIKTLTIDTLQNGEQIVM